MSERINGGKLFLALTTIALVIFSCSNLDACLSNTGNNYNDATIRTTVATKTPTQLPVPTSTPNSVVELDRGGVTISLSSPYIASVEDLSLTETLWIDDTDITLVKFYVVVRNGSSQVISVYPEYGTIVVGDEQADLQDYFFLHDDIGGELQPGVVRSGFVYFGLKRHTPDEITNIRYIIDVPYDENFRKISNEDYLFNLNIVN